MTPDRDIDGRVAAFVSAIKRGDDEAVLREGSILIATMIKALISLASSLGELAETSKPARS